MVLALISCFSLFFLPVFFFDEKKLIFVWHDDKHIISFAIFLFTHKIDEYTPRT